MHTNASYSQTPYKTHDQVGPPSRQPIRLRRQRACRVSLFFMTNHENDRFPSFPALPYHARIDYSPEELLIDDEEALTEVQNMRLVHAHHHCVNAQMLVLVPGQLPRHGNIPTQPLKGNITIDLLAASTCAPVCIAQGWLARVAFRGLMKRLISLKADPESVCDVRKRIISFL